MKNKNLKTELTELTSQLATTNANIETLEHNMMRDVDQIRKMLNKMIVPKESLGEVTVEIFPTLRIESFYISIEISATGSFSNRYRWRADACSDNNFKVNLTPSSASNNLATNGDFLLWQYDVAIATDQFGQKAIQKKVLEIAQRYCNDYRNLRRKVSTLIAKISDTKSKLAYTFAKNNPSLLNEGFKYHLGGIIYEITKTVNLKNKYVHVNASGKHTKLLTEQFVSDLYDAIGN